MTERRVIAWFSAGAARAESKRKRELITDLVEQRDAARADADALAKAGKDLDENVPGPDTLAIRGRWDAALAAHRSE